MFEILKRGRNCLFFVSIILHIKCFDIIVFHLNRNGGVNIQKSPSKKQLCMYGEPASFVLCAPLSICDTCGDIP